MSESEPRPHRRHILRKLVIRREDHVGDPIAIAWLAPPETVGDAVIDRLRDYLGPRVRIAKAEISRDTIEVEVESRGWSDEAIRLAAAARDLHLKGARRNALSMCREAIELDPLNDQAWSTLGLILTDLEQDKEALDAFKHAREYGGSGIQVILAMLQCALRLERFAAAASYAQEALQADPKNLAARRALKAIFQNQAGGRS